MSNAHDVKFRIGNKRYPLKIAVEGKMLRFIFPFMAELKDEIKHSFSGSR